VPDNIVGQEEHPRKLVDRLGFGLEVDDRVVALFEVPDLIGEPALAPVVDVADRPPPWRPCPPGWGRGSA
jgi:hypothetical protein